MSITICSLHLFLLVMIFFLNVYLAYLFSLYHLGRRKVSLIPTFKENYTDLNMWICTLLGIMWVVCVHMYCSGPVSF